MSLFGVIPVLSFNYLLLSMLVIRCYAVVHKTTANGKRLCEGGTKKSENFYKHEPSKNHFRFFKLTKK